MQGYVLVGGWPASGKTTLARALASELAVAYLSKDQVKEALMDALGAPTSVQESRRLDRAAVVAVLTVARGCPAAVIDSTWFPYVAALVDDLGDPVHPLGVGPLVRVNTNTAVDVSAVAARVRAAMQS